MPIQVAIFHPAVDPANGANKVQWTATLPLKRGEYDLLNISLIGHDPNTGWSFERCHVAWRAAFRELSAEYRKLPWWDLAARMRLGRRAAVLRQRQGMG